jgi:hypothetical protein
MIDTGLHTVREFRLKLVCSKCSKEFSLSRFVNDEEVSDSNSEPDSGKMYDIIDQMLRKLASYHPFLNPADTEQACPTPSSPSSPS